ncbi:MAG: HNH endonuclease [Planctomycetota bacterium]|nr:HNH endonuclease [Planctomycetota bacterium]
MMTEQEFLKRLEGIKAWDQRGKRAPHKPLLLLMALGNIQRQEPDLRFKDIEARLGDLIVEFGPSGARKNPHQPFYRLRNDGLWEVRAPHGVDIRETSSGDARITDLRKAEGGFTSHYDTLLRSKPDLIAKAAKVLLDRHFTPGLHEDILMALNMAVERRTYGKSVVKRDPKFRSMILTAYEASCAVCGVAVTMNGISLGLEAAHVRWACHDGPSTVDNGVCLCAFHHKALDRGALGITEDHRVRIAPGIEGELAEAMFFRYGGEKLREPKAAPHISREFLGWHGEHIFKSEAA